MMVELIDDFFAGYPAAPGGSDKVDTDEADKAIDAIAKTVAELTSGQDGAIRQQLLEQLTHEIMNYDAEFRREDAAGAIGSHVAALAGERAKHAWHFQTASSFAGLDRGVAPVFIRSRNSPRGPR